MWTFLYKNISLTPSFMYFFFIWNNEIELFNLANADKRLKNILLKLDLKYSFKVLTDFGHKKNKKSPF